VSRVTNALEMTGGVVILLVVFVDVFTSVIVPRPTRRAFRPSGILVRFMWPTWRSLGLARWLARRDREGFLGMFAPLMVIVGLGLWVVSLVLGFALLMYAQATSIHPPLRDFGSAVYFAGTTALTIGYGDFVPASLATRLLALLSAGSGLATFAIVISYLFLLFGAFQRRENFVIVLDGSAGAPPSGVQLLETYRRLGLDFDLPALFLRGQRWAADILETHLAYPILGFFRSSHKDESWIGALGAVLDAATLLVTTLSVESPTPGQARLMIEVGTHLTDDLTNFFRIPRQREAGVERTEFETARSRLIAAGYACRDAEESWLAFRELRAEYASSLNAMARFWAIPPAMWIGDRSSIARH